MDKKRLGLWAALCLALILGTQVLAQGEVRLLVNRDNVNIRLFPAIGAEVVGSANAQTVFVATGRSPDNSWYQVTFAGSEAWIGAPVVTVLEGDPNALPVRDPRTIPYGGREAPRAGFTDRTSDIIARLPNTGVRLRSGPSTAYTILANPLRFSEFALLGRTADNRWVQVNFEGVLGWVDAQYIEIQGNRNLLELPIDGVVANALPLEIVGENELFGILRIMRERLDLAQPSLDTMRQVWTDAALGITPFCGGYPSSPTGFNTLPREIYAQYFATLDPLLIDFNAAMANVRYSIDLLVEACNRPGGQAVLTSVPVVTGGLQFVNDADAAFASLRRRIDELLPELGPNDCVFAFNGRVDVLPLFPVEQSIVEGEFSAGERTTLGFCFDATPLNVGYIEFLRDSEASLDVIIAVSPLDNPTNFIATAAGGSNTSETNVILTPINFPDFGRYLLIVSVRERPNDEPPSGRYALLLADVGTTPPLGVVLSYDENGDLVRNELTPVTDVGTGQQSTAGTVTNIQSIPINTFANPDEASGPVGAIAPGETIPAISRIEGWIQVRTSNGVNGWVRESLVLFVGSGLPSTTTETGGQTSLSSGNVVCPGVTLTCDELFTCSEVQACVNAGSRALDPNGNGIACDSTEGNLPLSCSVPAPR